MQAMSQWAVKGALYKQATPAQQLFSDSTSPDLQQRVKKVTDKFSENMHLIANEPSLAFFRIQEHVRKSLPLLVERKHDMLELQKKSQGGCFDVDYANSTVKTMQKSQVHFQNIQDLLKNALFMKQQINYEKSRRLQQQQQLQAQQSPHRSSAMMRTQTVDIPIGITNAPQRLDFTQSVRVNDFTERVPENVPRVRSSSFGERGGVSTAWPTKAPTDLHPQSVEGIDAQPSASGE